MKFNKDGDIMMELVGKMLHILISSSKANRLTSKASLNQTSLIQIIKSL